MGGTAYSRTPEQNVKTEAKLTTDKTAGMTASVIGGGPAGLMAAEVLARTGIAVTDYRQEVLHCDTLLSGCWRRRGAAFVLCYTIGRLLAIAWLATAGALDGRKAADYTPAMRPHPRRPTCR